MTGLDFTAAGAVQRASVRQPANICSSLRVDFQRRCVAANLRCAIKRVRKRWVCRGGKIPTIVAVGLAHEKAQREAGLWCLELARG